jgi:hypothetical protein
MAQGIRLEPRGFDEQWADNAAEIARWRSIEHGKACEPHHAAPPQRVREKSRRKAAPARRIGFTVVAGGLCVVGLVAYLLITLSGIGPPNAITRPADAKHEVAQKANAAQMTLEDRRREEDKRAADIRQRTVSRQQGSSTATEARERREQLAWQRFYQPSEICRTNDNRGSVACANEYARAKMEFDKRWAAGRL